MRNKFWYRIHVLNPVADLEDRAIVYSDCIWCITNKQIIFVLCCLVFFRCEIFQVFTWSGENLCFIKEFLPSGYCVIQIIFAIAPLP